MGDVAATTVFLVRHAAHDRVDHVLCGRMPDVRLGEVGRAQARRLAERLSGEALDAVYTSPMERCRETAAPIAAAPGCRVAISDGLNEIDCGDWTGRPFAELAGEAAWQLWNRERATASAPFGEAMSAVQSRSLAAVESFVQDHPNGRVAAVSHADVIKAVACAVLGLSLDRHSSFDIGPASVTTLVLWKGGGKVVALNELVATP